jgi:glutaminase
LAVSPTPSPLIEEPSVQTPVAQYLARILESVRPDDSGDVAAYIPELAVADPTPLAVALCMGDGTLYTAGDADLRFSIQSISKPFAYALALRDRGRDRVLESVGVEPSGDAFNEISLQPGSGRPDNPMINIGAITTHTLVGDGDLGPEARAARVIEGLGSFAGRELAVDEAVFRSEMSENWRNLALAALVRANGAIDVDPEDAVAGYTRQCSVLVDTRDLAVMAMTLASGGINPVTGDRVVSESICRQVLSVMTSCGMYDAAGDWLSTLGIPAKSGVAGGILGALPGQVGVGAFSPRLDTFGNSVRGVALFERLSENMNLHLMRTPPPSLDVIGRRSTTRLGRTRVALQGALTFATTELALRHLAGLAPGRNEVVVDLSLVPSADDVSVRMLAEGVRRLTEDGHRVLLADPHGRLDALGETADRAESADPSSGRGRDAFIRRIVPEEA